jgi:hypothetical protein
MARPKRKPQGPKSPHIDQKWVWKSQNQKHKDDHLHLGLGVIQSLIKKKRPLPPTNLKGI